MNVEQFQKISKAKGKLGTAIILGVACLFAFSVAGAALAKPPLEEEKAPPAKEMKKPKPGPRAKAKKPAPKKPAPPAPKVKKPAPKKPGPPPKHHKVVGKQWVRNLQAALNRHGYHIKVDGLMGRQTRDALRDFQRRHHLKITGLADKPTKANLGIR